MAGPPKKGRQGFASLSPEQRLAVARKGGASVPGAKRSFYLNRALATDAGRKGGAASRRGPAAPRAAPDGEG